MESKFNQSFGLFVQIMGKEVTSENKMKLAAKDEGNDHHLDIPKVKSSKELLRRLQVKREKGSTVVATKAPLIVPNGQFNLSNFEVRSQNKNTLSSSVEPPIKPSQNMVTVEVMNGKRKGPFLSNKETVQTINESRAKIRAISRSLIAVQAKKNAKNKVNTLGEKSKSNPELIKASLQEVGNSNAKQQPPKKEKSGDVSSKRTQNFMGEWMSTIDMFHQKNAKKVITQGEKSKSRLQLLEASLREVGNSNKQPPNLGISGDVTSKRIQNVVHEGVNIVDKTKENQKSVKRVEVERDTSKGNEKKKRPLTEGYQSIVGNEFDVKKQPTRLCGSMMIGEFLYQKGEKVEQVVEEENDHQDDEFQNETEDEGHEEESFNEREENEIINEEESLNEREDNELTTDEGNIAFLQILLLIIYLCI